jgi:methylmalonyl-CoA/ethylmalonyl-CoA epimerase
VSKKIIKNIQEVVLAVEKQDEAVALFEELFGLEFKEGWDMPTYDMKVKAANVGETQFQIITPTKSESMIAKYIQDRGEGLHHIAFTVYNLDETVAKLKEKNVKLIPESPVAVEGRPLRYIFVHPKSAHGVLIELLGE